MAINKNFVIKNGAEINTKLLVADANNQTIGIGTTSATYTLHVFGPGGIGATFVNVTGITTTQALNVLGVSTFSTGPVLVARGELTGTASQSLQVGTATTVSGAYISGNLGVGATLPNAKLEVVPTASGSAGIFSGTTSGDMVRITQLGAGNALVVEDETNTDATSFVISGLGSVGIGTAVPRYLLDIDGTKVASEGVAVGQTAVYIRGDVKIVGDLSVDDITLDQIINQYLNVSGFGTVSSLLVPNTASINVGIITSIQGGNLSLAGVTTGLNAPGISTLGFVQHTTLNVTGFSTLGSVNVGNVNIAGVTTGLNVPGISTLASISGTNLNVSGVTTSNSYTIGGTTVINASRQLQNIASLDATTTATIESAIANAPNTFTDLNVTGFSTLGAVSATNLALAGITTGLNVSGVLTATSFTGSGANLTSLNATQLTSGTVPGARINAAGGDFTVGNNLYVNGILSVGGTTVILNVQQLQISDRDITLGVTTDANGVDISTDNTANHGGISVASTVGTPIINIPTDAVNNSPSTYKQIMWIKQGHYSGLGTDVWAFNYGVSIGNTATVQNGSRLTVGAGFTVYDTYLDAQDIRARNINAVGVATIPTLNATTLNVTGFSTFGAASATRLSVSGVSTIANLLVTPSASGVGATVGTSAGVVTYFGDGSRLSNIISGVGIQSAGSVIGYGVTTLNFVGSGNTFAYNQATNTVDITIRGGGGVGFATYNAGIATASSVGVRTTNLDNAALTGVGNSFNGLYIGNGMLIVDNQLNGNHYIGTNFNGLMAGPVTINGTLTVDGNYVVV